MKMMKYAKTSSDDSRRLAVFVLVFCWRVDLNLWVGCDVWFLFFVGG